MRKIIFTIVFALIVLMVIACKSLHVKTEEISTEEAMRKTYELYYDGLILDGADTYTVVKGDTPSYISRLKYDNSFYFPIIMMASKDIVLDPDKIVPGMVLTIPQINLNLDDPLARENIKSLLEDIARIEDDRDRFIDAGKLRELASTL
jgi:hypothetical protein